MPDGFMAISSRGEEEALWLRTSILEGLSNMAGPLDQVIAGLMTLDEGHREILEKDLLPRVPLAARVSTLVKLLRSLPRPPGGSALGRSRFTCLTHRMFFGTRYEW